jgi:predicted CXXCH cytochrome family protein
LLCHAQPGLTTKVDGQERTIAAVDQAAFTSSAHAGQTCVSCHADESALPHPLASRATPSDGVTACAACHLDAYEGYLESPHGTMADLRDGSGPTCADCHGSAHAVRPIRAWSDEQRAQICAGCHTGAGTDFLGALSHEAPSPRHLQLVYFAGRFLTILAASSLAFGIIHVELDLLRWLVRRWRSRPARREPWEST